MKCCLLLLAAALAAACSTTAAPGVCCIGPEACGRLGLDEDRPCPAGQACVDLQCAVPSCTNQGCTADAPVCEAESGACRGCRADAECPSGACAESGACAAEEDVVYLAPDGADSGMCTRGSPCRSMQFGATRTTLTRSHLVLTMGHYDLQGGREELTVQNTPARHLSIHGGGSLISTTSDGAVVSIFVDSFIRDLEIQGNGRGLSLGTTGTSALENVHVRGSNVRGIVVAGDVSMRNVVIEGAAMAIVLEFAARLTLSGGVIKHSGAGIVSLDATAVVDVTNLLVFDLLDVAFDLTTSAGGKINFTTIADTGTSTSTGPLALKGCSFRLSVRSSILWMPAAPNRAAIDTGCTLSSTIVGPLAIPGASNEDPRFVDPSTRDYHLSPASPARDTVDVGPMTDFEGDPRPRGPRFDIGADEAP